MSENTELSPIAELVVRVHDSASICDMVNGRPNAWKDGYAGVAYPDMGGVEIPGTEVVNGRVIDYVYVRWGEYIYRGADGTWRKLPFEVGSALDKAGLLRDGDTTSTEPRLRDMPILEVAATLLVVLPIVALLGLAELLDEWMYDRRVARENERKRGVA